MFRRLTAAAGILLAATALAAPAANAEIAPIDETPAATLLLPYFEVDTNAPAPDASTDNVLWGDYFHVDPGTGQAPAPGADDVTLVDESVSHLDKGNSGRGGGHGGDGGDRGRDGGHDRGGDDR